MNRIYVRSERLAASIGYIWVEISTIADGRETRLILVNEGVRARARSLLRWLPVDSTLRGNLEQRYVGSLWSLRLDNARSERPRREICSNHSTAMCTTRCARPRRRNACDAYRLRLQSASQRVPIGAIGALTASLATASWKKPLEEKIRLFTECSYERSVCCRSQPTVAARQKFEKQIR